MVLTLAAGSTTAAPVLQLVGAGLFGLVIGWFCYFVNRHRHEDVKLTDVAGFAAAIGGGAVLTLFPSSSDLFAVYGIGLAAGFFGYFVVLCVLVRRAGWGARFLLDGRVPDLAEGERAGDGGHPFGLAADAGNPGQPPRIRGG
jgi:hypothetical protein